MKTGRRRNDFLLLALCAKYFVDKLQYYFEALYRKNSTQEQVTLISTK